MAAKLLRSLTDENPDLQKQIGCMTGIFQIFDRQNMITPKRITGHNLKRLPNDDSPFNDSALEAESNTTYGRSMPMEKHSRRHVLDKQKMSTESSRASFSSSSRSSSFSSLDFNKNSQQDALSFDRITFPENPSKDAVMSQPSLSSQLARQSLDLRDVVKDSMYRESQGLPVKTKPKHEKTVDSLVKVRDSPRHINLSRGDGETYGLSFKRKEESATVPAKLREAPRFVNEPRELYRSASYHSKDGSFFSMAKEAPRFSYDGKDARYGLYESRENSKSSLKPPRLSLDSRESSMRSLKSEAQPDLSRKSLQNDGVNGIHPLSQQQTSGSQTRPPSVVAKLMGLEVMPHSDISDEMETSSSKKRTVEDSSGFYKTPTTTVPSGPIKIAIPSRSLWKEPSSPRWRAPDSSVKPVSRLPMEPAPWKQVDGNRKSPNASKGMKAPVRSQNMFPTVFGEIEKRLKDLEFSQSAKDLRALKQILEAMQAKGLLESQKEDDSSFATKRDLGNTSNSIPPSDGRKAQNDQGYASRKRGNNFSRNYESPIVIMKPAKLLEKSGIPPTSVISMKELSHLPGVQGGGFVDNRSSANSRATRGQVPKSNSRDNVSNDIKSNNRTSRTTRTSARYTHNSKEGNSVSSKVSGSISPRMHQKKQELDKSYRPPMSPSDSGRSQRPSYKQGTESSSPGGRCRPKASVIHQNDDQLSDISNESRHLSYQGNEYSAQSDGSIISESPMDIEVNSLERTPEVDNRHIPSMKTANNLVSCLIEKKSTLLLHENEVPMEQPVVAPEYPSPVSVLDNVLDMYDSPSPVKHKIKTTRGDKSNEYDTAPCSEQHIPGVGSLTNAFSSVPTSEVNRKKLQKIESLVKKLQRLNSTHDEGRTDYIASLCENTNPDHRYISEILLASGLLLSDLDSSLTYFQFHPSGHPINPELFLVLEQTKARTFFKGEPDSEKTVQLRSKQKIHRKLIFDTINEVLARKLSSLGLSSEPWMLRPHKLARETLNAQKLLRELCIETEKLQSMISKGSSEDEDDGLTSILWEDVMHRSESWTDCSNGVSGVVLDIERLVFKDLINDIVIGEALGLENKHVSRRQLFAK